jgi:hypothetical protein
LDNLFVQAAQQSPKDYLDDGQAQADLDGWAQANGYIFFPLLGNITISPFAGGG